MNKAWKRRNTKLEEKKKEQLNVSNKRESTTSTQNSPSTP